MYTPSISPTDGQLVLFAPKPAQEMKEEQRVREVQRINSQAAKEDALRIWNLLRAVRVQSSLSGSGRPRLLLQREILPLDGQRAGLPLNLVKKRSKEVVF